MRAAAIAGVIFVSSYWTSNAFANAFLSTGCTGAIFIMPGMTDQRNAHVLTSGHCLELGGYEWQGRKHLAPGQRLVNVSLKDEKTFSITIFKNNRGNPQIYIPRRIVFATITISDLAIIELNISYADIRRLGYGIYSIAGAAPSEGAKLRFKSYSADYDGICTVVGIAPTLTEGPYVWINVVKMQVDERCRVFPGVSGTPGIPEGSNTIYAVANTEYTSEGCGIMNPCETNVTTGALDPGRPTQSYAIPTAPLNACYDRRSRNFDFDLPSCMLTHK